MDKKLVVKMIKNCFKQYYETDSLPISEQDLDLLVNRILQTKGEEPAANLYEVVNDVIYEYLTN
ncbi:YqzH family protein [Bacillus sp. USDA818B3_A]|uniref:YqzH family protein n=1 Tax=Bacillus sp. USDA818B3_A TaxID=2698834 RepID=UPI001371F543|nr:YqzH family protein [Bacillus sp. USDA818B3_A]